MVQAGSSRYTLKHDTIIDAFWIVSESRILPFKRIQLRQTRKPMPFMRLQLNDTSHIKTSHGRIKPSSPSKDHQSFLIKRHDPGPEPSDLQQSLSTQAWHHIPQQMCNKRQSQSQNPRQIGISRAPFRPPSHERQPDRVRPPPRARNRNPSSEVAGTNTPLPTLAWNELGFANRTFGTGSSPRWQHTPQRRGQRGSSHSLVILRIRKQRDPRLTSVPPLRIALRTHLLLRNSRCTQNGAIRFDLSFLPCTEASPWNPESRDSRELRQGDDINKHPNKREDEP